MTSKSKKQRIICIVSILAMMFTTAPTVAYGSCNHGSAKGTFMGQPAYVKDGKLTVCSHNFPDRKFRENILNKPMGKDGVITEREVRNLQQLTFPGRGIADFTGLNYFTNLTTFRCVGNFVEELDVSKLTKLTSLNVSTNNLKSLDLSKNTKLEKLHCQTNYITDLDLSSNTELETVQVNNNELTDLALPRSGTVTTIKCQNNELEGLDLTGQTALEEFYGRNNRFGTLDFSGAPSVETISCDKSGLESLVLTGCAALKTLDCDWNELGTLDLSTNTALRELHCDANGLTSLDLGNLSALTVLGCAGNEIKSLDTSANTSLKQLDCSDNDMESLRYDTESMAMIWCQGNELTDDSPITGSSLSRVYMDGSHAGITLSENSSGKWEADLSPLMEGVTGNTVYKYCNISKNGFDADTYVITADSKPSCVGAGGKVNGVLKMTYVYFPQDVSVLDIESPTVYTGTFTLPTLVDGEMVAYEDSETVNYHSITAEPIMPLQGEFNGDFSAGPIRVKLIGDHTYTGEAELGFVIRPAATRVVKVEAPAAKRLKVTWHPSEGAYGYQVRLGTNSSVTKGLKTFTVGRNTFSKTFTGLTRDKRYYAKVRPYVTSADGAKWYGEWSNSKALMTLE